MGKRVKFTTIVKKAQAIQWKDYQPGDPWLEIGLWAWTYYLKEKGRRCNAVFWQQREAIRGHPRKAVDASRRLLQTWQLPRIEPSTSFTASPPSRLPPSLSSHLLLLLVVQIDDNRYDYLKNPEGCDRHGKLIIHQKEEEWDIIFGKEKFFGRHTNSVPSSSASYMCHASTCISSMSKC